MGLCNANNYQTKYGLSFSLYPTLFFPKRMGKLQHAQVVINKLNIDIQTIKAYFMCQWKGIGIFINPGAVR